MISSIFLSGRLGELISPTCRYVEVDRPIPENGRFITDKFVVKSQCTQINPFMKEPVGSYICLKGRLEVDDKLGIIIIIEIDEMYRFPEGTKRI